MFSRMGLRAKLSLLTALLIMVTAAGIAAYITRQEQREARAALESEGVAVLSLLTEAGYPALAASNRQALGQIHPAFMGGEYLPDLSATETMIARITIASTTQDVTCVYARRGKGRIYYRAVDEYGGETLSGKSARTSSRPLSLRELDAFFSAVEHARRKERLCDRRIANDS